MNSHYLDFEQPIADLENKIAELRQASASQSVNVDAEIKALEDKLKRRSAQIFRNLSPWQILQVARHPQRPYFQDYIEHICASGGQVTGDYWSSKRPRYQGKSPT